MHLFTQRCLIRELTENDASALFDILSNENVMKYIDHPFSFDQTREFIIEAGLCDPPLVYALIWRSTGALIGHVIFHEYDKVAYEIGWIIHESYWGKGIASEITEALLYYAKDIGIKSCVIECDPKQSASIHIAQKSGFIYVGEDDGCLRYRVEI